MFSAKNLLIGILLFFITGIAAAQCPENIGFDFGNFQDWVGSTGAVATDGSISMTSTGIVNGRHTIFFAKDKQIDPYGKFLIASPNGSSCCVRLGDSNTGRQAEQLSYTFTVPKNNPDFSLIYYYAVVLQNPGHLPYQEPRFTANVFDVTDNKYISCGGFLFEASSNLPGFKPSALGTSVLYKDWSAVTINLLGFEGKTLRLEFTTNDCTQGGHFGYAYLDVNQNCTSPVSGNVYCGNNTGPVTLTAPAGFQAYYWYEGTDYSKIIGISNTLNLNPAPPVGASYSLRIVPYPGIGCEDTLHTVIRATEPLIFNLKDTVVQCKLPSVNLTDTALTSGSNFDFTYTYFSDPACLNNIIGPQAITKSGTYYVKATSPGGCSVVKPIVLQIGLATLNVADPPVTCGTQRVDLTSTSVAAANGGSKLTYWKDLAATKPVSNPSLVDSTGTYYIKLTTPEGCTVVKPVNVTINPLPTLLVTDPPQTCTGADLTTTAVTAGSSSGATYTYYTDTLCTTAIVNPKNVPNTGTYYIKATVPGGCYIVMPVKVTAPEVLNLIVTDTVTVCKLPGLDITNPVYIKSGNADFIYTYYSDPAGVNQLIDPRNITVSGTYYIKGTTPIGCSVIKPVQVVIIDEPDITVTDPAAVCEPATVDLSAALTIGPTFSGPITYWKDANATRPVTNQGAIDSTGTYYVKAVNAAGCSVVDPIRVTVNKLPKVVITDQFDCYFVDITTARTNAGSSAGLTFSYWLDAAATKPLLKPNAVAVSGTYYISGTTAVGCTVTKPINVNVYTASAIIKVTNPLPVVYPTEVDLKSTFTPAPNVLYTFWADSALTKSLTSSIVTKGGKYYIEATSVNGCSNEYGVLVTVNKPPAIDFQVNVFTPNGDGVNDKFKFTVPFYVTLKSFKIYDRYGQSLFETTDPAKYWDGKSNGQFVPVGTYYWIFDAYDNYSQVAIKQSGSISVLR